MRHSDQKRSKRGASARAAIDFPLFLTTVLLVGFGLVMVFSASSMTSWRADAPSAAGVVSETFDPWYYTKRQAAFALGGLVCMFAAMSVPYRAFRKLYIPFFVAMIPLLAATPFVAEDRNGARSWIPVGPFTLQPSEFAKLALILYLASVISKKGDGIRDLRKGFLPVAAVVALFAGLIMCQNDVGTALIVVAIAGVMLLVGGTSWKHLAASGIVAMAAVAILVLEKQYRLDRILSFLHPEQDRLGSGYQLLQSLYAFSHGGWQGAGLGQSIQKLYYIPEAHNDFIFSIIGEEFGFVGTSLFIAAYVFFVWRGVLLSLRSPDAYGMLLGIGIMSWFAIQAVVNIGGVTGSMPLTGVTLPFISYGGSSLVASMTAVGIVLGISRERSTANVT
ncbi:MAG: putative lipid II flippase FtsW [Candidatus Reconcilbacillus cellulovorans]|uniref:Probable peptidoglycan glycosyltransferase FtsW n=1 Tax=Candidatus Reconcilbacillus cellulovorans TaxID=1906605 RepID=A0A2A6E433_9BACL|nr:MAG: putative lipid II flippase FtsW [Candidatus Reconcilbacillus cellulovorans]